MVFKSTDDGDLFPRGSGPDAQPRIKKRNGEVSLGSESKRPRIPRQSEIIAPPSDAPVEKFGAALSFSRISPGMTCLGLVVKANSTTIEIVLPSGIKAKAIDDTIIEDEQLSRAIPPVFNSASSKNVGFKSNDRTSSDDDDNDSSESSDPDMNDDETNDGYDDAACAGENEVQPLWRVLSAGQIFPVSIIDIEKVGQFRLVTVSLKPHLVNVGLNAVHLLKKGFSAYAAILSVEDHGYILSFGSNIPYKAFLPFDKCGDSEGEKPSLRPGTPIEIVTEKDIQVSEKSRGSAFISIPVSACRSQVYSASIEGFDSTSFQDLRAGMLLNARVMKEGPGGLHLLASGVFPISVDSLHVPRSTDGEKATKVNKRVVVRLLYVDPFRKSIGASLLDSLVRNMSVPNLPKAWDTGTLLKPLEVMAIHPGHGLLLRISTPTCDEETLDKDVPMEGNTIKHLHKTDVHLSSEVSVYAHFSRLSDSKSKHLDSTFQQGMKFESGGRIVSISRLDGVINVDMRPSVLSRKALTIDEVKPGSIYDCKILFLQRSGSLKVAVDGDSKLVGTIRPVDISDIPISLASLPKHESFQIGSTLKCRVLSVEMDFKVIHLTARKSMLNPRYPVLTSLEQAAETMHNTENFNEPRLSPIFTGNVLRATQNDGLLVRFCNKIVGVVQRSELSLSSNNLSSDLSMKEINSMYPVGQTVYVRVMHVNPNRQTLFLSMNLSSKHNPMTGISIGDFVNGTIVDADDDSGHFVISVKVPGKKLDTSSNSKSGEKIERLENQSHHHVSCYLPFGHISDIPAVSDHLSVQLSKRIKSQLKRSKKQGFQISSALVLTIREETPLLTLKASLKDACSNGNLPSTYEEVKNIVKRESTGNNSILRGYIKALLPSGVIAGFLGDTVGFIHISKLSDHFVSDPAKFVQVNQSVATVVESLDDEKNRFQLSSRLSDVGLDPLELDALSAFRSFEEWQIVFGASSLQQLSAGCKVRGTVQSVHPHGVQYSLDTSGVKAIGVVFHGNGITSEVDEGNSSLTKKSKRHRRQKCTENQSKNVIESPAIGENHEVVILDVDPVSSVVDLSKDEELLSGVLNKSKLVPGSVMDARVLLVKSMYIVLLVRRYEKSYLIAHALKPISNDPLMLLPGSHVKCRILEELTCGGRIITSIALESLQGVPKAKSSPKRSGVNAIYNETISSIRRYDGGNDATVLGLEVSGRVFRRNSTQASISIAPGIIGNLHICKTAFLSTDELASLPLGTLSNKLSKKFSLPAVQENVGPLYIIGIQKAEEANESALTVVDLATSLEHVKSINLVEGKRTVGFVKRLSSRFLQSDTLDSTTRKSSRTLISANSSNLVFCNDIDSLPLEGNSNLVERALVVCQIINEKSDDRLAQGCLSENGQNKEGFYFGITISSNPGTGLRVLIPWLARDNEAKRTKWGIVGLCDLDSDFDKAAELIRSLKAGDVVRVREVERDVGSKSLDKHGGSIVVLSMRDHNEKEPKDILLDKENISNLKVGSTIRGFVKAIGEKGCFVGIGRNIDARIELRNLSDEFISDPERKFPVGTLLKGLIENVSTCNGRVFVSMTLRKKLRSQIMKANASIDIREGVVVNGLVKRIKSFGAVVELPNGTMSTLFLSEVDQDRYVTDSSQEWITGQKICVVVIGVKGKSVRVGTKRCYFEAAGKTEEEVDHILEQNETYNYLSSCNSNAVTDNLIQSVEIVDSVDENPDEENLNEDNSDEENPNVENSDEENPNEDNSDEGNSDDNSDEDRSKGTGPNIMIVDNDNQGNKNVESSKDIDGDVANGEYVEKSVTPLKVNHKFNFNDNGIREIASESTIDKDLGTLSQSTNDELLSKRTSRGKREKKRQKDMKETETRLREEALARNADAPETAEDYERMLMGEPNSSELWIRFMAFCLQLSQVEKARAVAERALDTIALEKESERLNVWVAYVNLEAQFGNMNAKDVSASDNLEMRRDAAVFRVFDRGCERVTDVQGFHLQVTHALQQTNPSIADEILRRAVRKFKSSKEVWISMGQAFFSRGNLNEGRKCLDRALISLDKKDHIAVITKFAQLEYKLGSVERGSTIFESLVGNYPKRTDLWNIYLDMEMGRCKKFSESGNNEECAQNVLKTRRLLDRFTSLDLSSKKMRFSFKRWLDFEKTYGSKDDEKVVKDRAREYVERKQD